MGSRDRPHRRNGRPGKESSRWSQRPALGFLRRSSCRRPPQRRNTCPPHTPPKQPEGCWWRNTTPPSIVCKRALRPARRFPRNRHPKRPRARRLSRTCRRDTEQLPRGRLTGKSSQSGTARSCLGRCWSGIGRPNKPYKRLIPRRRRHRSSKASKTTPQCSMTRLGMPWRSIGRSTRSSCLRGKRNMPTARYSPDTGQRGS